jgi:hypothetical protein
MLHEQGGYTVLAIAPVVRGPVVLCVVILLGIMGAGCAADSYGSSTTLSGTSSATDTPTAPASPTATYVPPIPLSSTVLGGGAQAFLDKLGTQSIVAGGPPQYYQSATYRITASDGTTVRLQVYNDDQQNGRVPQIILTPPDWQVTSWGSQTTDRIVGPYLPRDSKYVKEMPAGDGSFSVGTKRIYQSAALAASFDGSYFTDGTNPLPPGTFSLTCEHYTKAPQQGTDICYLNLGITDN